MWFLLEMRSMKCSHFTVVIVRYVLLYFFQRFFFHRFLFHRVRRKPFSSCYCPQFFIFLYFIFVHFKLNGVAVVQSLKCSETIYPQTNNYRQPEKSLVWFCMRPCLSALNMIYLMDFFFGICVRLLVLFGVIVVVRCVAAANK